MPRAALPIDPLLPEVVAATRARGGAVVLAPTGSGKTTRVPPALLDARPGERVLLVQPRRVAARAAARRIAAERGVRLGGEVGYQVRFDRRASPGTRLLVATEGIPLRLLQDDPFLEAFGTIVLDEVHERSLDLDLLLALVQRIRAEVRPDLRVVAMSATLDTGPVAAFLGDVPVVRGEGRSFPVAIEHAPPATGTPIEGAVRAAVADALGRHPGDVLVFLPGRAEIGRAAGLLEDVAARLDVDVLELHGDLPPEQQDAALEPGPRRRVVLATNVAETSLTIPGVRIVVDAGLERVPRVDPATGLERLETTRIARASADQRAGRAGRTAPGVCVRLYPRAVDAALDARRVPEILRGDLAGMALRLHAWGEHDLAAFPFFEAPPPAALDAAELLLGRLGALEDGRVTDTGRAMAGLPVHPRLARMLLEARTAGHARRLALAAAVLAERPPFVRGETSDAPAHAGPSDVLDAVEALEAFEQRGLTTSPAGRVLHRGAARHALRARDQLARLLPEGAAGGDPDEAVLRAVLAGWPDRVARRRADDPTRAVMVGGRGLRLAPSSVVRDAPLFVAVDVDAGRAGPRAEAFVRSASRIDRAWLAPARVVTEETAGFDPARGSVQGSRRTRYEDLVLEEVAVQVPRGEAVEAALAEAARADLARALPLDDEAVVSLRARVACLRAWRPELALPALDDDAVAGLLPDLVRGRRSFEELRRAPLPDHLRALLGGEALRALDREAPEHLVMPRGRRVRLRYEAGRPPVLAVRIQDAFGLAETPRVAAGRVKVLVHLLAPNHRPQQITDDMPSFWSTTYAQVRAELRRRYPKHAWPEDPT